MDDTTPQSEPQPRPDERPRPEQPFPEVGSSAAPNPRQAPRPQEASQPQQVLHPQAGQGGPPAGRPPRPYPVAPPPGRPAKEGSFKRGFGLGAGVGLGFGGMLLIVSLIGSLLTGLLMMGFSSAAASLAGAGQVKVEGTQTVWGKDAATKKLRAIPITGAIQTQGATGGFALQQGTYGYEVADVLDKLEAADADGVVLLMDTPGGTVTGARAISDAVDRYRTRTGKKVYAFVQGMSASGGMYAMAGADEIVADHGTLIGHVGVIMGPFAQYTNVTSDGSLLTGQVTADKIDQIYVTAGRGKDVGNPYRPMTDQERAMLQEGTDNMYADFVDHVATKRRLDRNVIIDELGAGIFDEKKAEQVGYIDDIMNREDALRHFAQASGLDPNDTKLVQATAPDPWMSLFGVQLRTWGTAPAAQPVGNQPARATAEMCLDRTTPLAWHGSLAGVCG